MDKDLADIVFQPLNSFQNDYESFTLFYDRSVVVLHKDTEIPEELRRCAISRDELIARNYPPEKIVSNPSLFRDVEFINIPSILYINKRREELFGKYKSTPHVISRNDQIELNLNLVAAGFGTLLTTETQISISFKHPDCLYFALGSPNAVRPYSVAFRKDGHEYIRSLIKAFIEAAREFTNCENPITKVLAP